MKKRIFLLFLLFTLLFTTSALAATDDTTQSLLPTIPGLASDIDKYPLQNYIWDWTGLLSKYDNKFSNSLLGFAAFMARVSILILQLGNHPDVIGSFIGSIVNVIHASQEHFLPRIWPYASLGMMIALFIDYAKSNMQGMIKRLLTFVVILFALGAFYNMTEDGVNQVTGAAGEATEFFTGGIIAAGAPIAGEGDVFNSQDFLKTEDNVYKIIWKILIENPWQIGEFGVADAKIGADDLDKVKKALKSDADAPAVSESTRWADVVLHYPVGSSERDNLVDILNDDKHKASKASFDNTDFRSKLAWASLLNSVLVLPFIFLSGIVLVLAYVCFLIALLAGIWFLPVSLIPASQRPASLRWWVTFLLVPLVLKIGVSLYVGFAFLCEILIGKLSVGGGTDPQHDKWGLLVTMFISSLGFVAAMIFPWLILKFFPSVRRNIHNTISRRLSHYIDDDAPDFTRMKARYRRAAGRSGGERSTSNPTGRFVPRKAHTTAQKRTSKATDQNSNGRTQGKWNGSAQTKSRNGTPPHTAAHNTTSQGRPVSGRQQPGKNRKTIVPGKSSGKPATGSMRIKRTSPASKNHAQNQSSTVAAAASKGSTSSSRPIRNRRYFDEGSNKKLRVKGGRLKRSSRAIPAPSKSTVGGTHRPVKNIQGQRRYFEEGSQQKLRVNNGKLPRRPRPPRVHPTKSDSTDAQVGSTAPTPALTGDLIKQIRESKKPAPPLGSKNRHTSSTPGAKPRKRRSSAPKIPTKRK